MKIDFIFLKKRNSPPAEQPISPLMVLRPITTLFTLAWILSSLYTLDLAVASEPGTTPGEIFKK